MTMRITGLASGLDVDSLVKDSLKPYQLKIDQAKQAKQTIQWKQQQYQKIMSDVTTFYNKYLDPTSANSLFSNSAYNTTSFTSANSNAVTATAVGTAVNQDYQVSVSQLASKASATLNSTNLAGVVAANGSSSNATATTTIGGQTLTFAVNDGTGTRYDAATLRSKLDSAITSQQSSLQSQIDAANTAGDTTTATSLQKTLDIFNSATSTLVDTDKDAIINGSDLNSTTAITLKYKADGATTTTDISFNVVSTVAGNVDYTKTLANYNAANTIGVSATYSDFSQGLVFTGKVAGQGSFTIENGSGTQITQGKSTKLNAVIKNSAGEIYTIDDNTPQTSQLQNNKITLDGVAFNFYQTTYATDASGNYLDVSGNITTDPTKYVSQPVKISGKQDTTALKDKIVSFINDYDTILGSINTKIYETYDKDYPPLTDDQRSQMTDSQIQNWETKAQTGLLHNDDTLSSLAESMKDAMSTFMYGSNIDLESIGITPLKDEWTDKNGLYEVDEDKLTQALQDNFSGIKDLFMKNPTATDTSNSGIIPQIKKIFNDNVIKFDSTFNQLAGGGTYILTNELTKELDDKNQQISDMTKDLADRSDSLYSKYSKLETALAQAQSQQSSMSSWFSSSSS